MKTQSKELNEFERSLVPEFIAGFQKRIGPGQAISNTEIQRRFNDKRITARTVRDVVQYIRKNQGGHTWFGNRILIANGTGYFVTNDERLIRQWIESLEGQIRSRQQLIEGAKVALSKMIDPEPQIQFK